MAPAASFAGSTQRQRRNVSTPIVEKLGTEPRQAGLDLFANPSKPPAIDPEGRWFRMSKDLTTASPSTYGGLKPSGSLGADGFAEHDHRKAWADNGAAETLAMSLAPDIAHYGAEQAKQALLDYGQNAFADTAVVNGEIVLMVDLSNNEAAFAPFWNLLPILQKSAQEAENSSDEAYLRAFGKMLDQLNATFRPPARAAQPSRPLRQGGSRPTGAVRPAAARSGRVAASRPPE